MRVLMVNHEFSVSGSSLAFFRLATELQALGHAVSVFPCNADDGPIARQYIARAIPIMPQVVTSEFDVAIGSTICSAPRMIELAPYMPTIWFVNEAEIGFDLLLRHPEWVRAFAVVSAVIFNTPFQHDFYRSFVQHLDPAKFHTVPFGVEVDAATLPMAKVAPKRRAWRVVQVGRLSANKRQGDLLDAASHSGLEVECVLCGPDFGLMPELHARADADPAGVRLLCNLPHAEMMAWVASADMFCLPSASETQGLAVYEAALLDRPLLLSDLRCYAGVFRHGRECLLFPTGQVRLLAGLMRVLAEDAVLRRDLSTAAKASAARFTHARFLAHFEAVLGDVVQQYSLRRAAARQAAA